jgi:MazG family protein
MAAADLPHLRRLLEVIARLRAPDGCPWDRQQTEASMAPYLLEEAYEALEALQSGNHRDAREELGDVLMNVLMIAQIASERGTFDAEAVAAAIADKLVRRHPHVFGGQRVDGADAAYRSWERMKQQEDPGTGRRKGILDGVPVALPALLRAFRIGEKAARAGFDWPDAAGPRAKIDEELGELDRALAAGDEGAAGSELGDLLFSVVNFARHRGINPEMALRATTARFQRRFAAIEQDLGPDLQGRSLAELEAAWQRAKDAEAQPGA